jgi:POT family proton-dependent oligopeptide transporter
MTTTPVVLASSAPPGPESADGFRTAPDNETTGWPAGIPYIVGNEVCERFSFYGMKALLQPHFVLLFAAAGNAEKRANDLANSSVHFFGAGAFALPIIGAIMADRLAGKYRTIFWLSLVYCLGHGVLAIAENSLLGMYIGLALVAIGAGGIKPCVSANVGDQFGRNNSFRIQTIFQIFYFSINFGSFFATILCPFTMKWWGPAWAFGIPGVLMLIATILFWMGRRKFVHVPAKPGGMIGLLDTVSSTFLFLTVGSLFVTSGLDWWWMVAVSAACLAIGLGLFFWRQRRQPDDGFLAITLYALQQRIFRSRPGAVSTSTSNGTAIDDKHPSEYLVRSRFWGPAVRRFGLEATEGPVAVFKVLSIFLLISMFWMLFEQRSTTWTVQAGTMDLRYWGEHRARNNQLQAFNPLMVMLLIPLLNPIYGRLGKWGWPMTPLRRITIGIGVAALAFVGVALLQIWIDAEGVGRVWFGWQAIPYLIITVAELLVSITGLEFAYTQAPKRMKSTVMGFWMLTIALGNVLAGLLARFFDLPPVQVFWLCAGLTAGAAAIFGVRAYFYTPRDFT